MPSITITGARGLEIPVPTGLFIDNAFVPATNDAKIPVENPAKAQVLGHVSAAQQDDVDLAVESSEAAFQQTWRQTSPETRRTLLYKLGDLIEQNAEELASIEAVDAGLLYRDSMGLSVPQAAEACRYFAGWADKIDGRSMQIPQGMAYTRREPIGVCAAIVPWNCPLMITAWKLAPAIAAGNTLIIKTPELAPLYGQKLAELVVEAGFPPGVINILCGTGAVAGQALVEHTRVWKVSFTGSSTVGRNIMATSSRTNLKKVTLELGGKGPSIVFADADIDNALTWTVAGITVHNGQICAAGSRIYIQREIYEKFVKEFSKRSLQAVAGDPLLDSTTKGPLISSGQRERVRSFVREAQADGTTLLHGGDEIDLPGYFQPNTAFTEVSSESRIIREEVFGPVASIAVFETEAEAIALVNDSDYGLSAAVFTSDGSKAVRVSDAIECGQVTINMWGTVNASLPFGGFKQSGLGSDLGSEAIDEWTQVKAVKWNIPKL